MRYWREVCLFDSQTFQSRHSTKHQGLQTQTHIQGSENLQHDLSRSKIRLQLQSTNISKLVQEAVCYTSVKKTAENMYFVFIFHKRIHILVDINGYQEKGRISCVKHDSNLEINKFLVPNKDVYK